LLDEFKITLFDKNGHILFSDKLKKFRLSESLIIMKSMEFFSDPSPCFIHRSAVMNRLYMEIEEFIKKEMRNGRTRWKRNQFSPIVRLILTDDVEQMYVNHNL
jgi:hypothetical protein